MLVLACLVAAVPFYLDSFEDRRGHLAADSRVITKMNVEVGRWINANTPIDSTVGVNDAGAIRYFGKRRTIDLLGLNNWPIAFRKVSKQAALLQADWLAIFPVLLQQKAFRNTIVENFDPRLQLAIPPQEYTICDCPLQTKIILLQKKGAVTK